MDGWLGFDFQQGQKLLSTVLTSLEATIAAIYLDTVRISDYMALGGRISE
jgi:hypothetical protein